MIWTLGGRPALDLSQENYFCDSRGSHPGLCPGHRPRCEGQSLNCASWELPLPTGDVDPDKGQGSGEGQAWTLAGESL